MQLAWECASVMGMCLCVPGLGMSGMGMCLCTLCGNVSIPDVEMCFCVPGMGMWLCVSGVRYGMNGDMYMFYAAGQVV